MIYKLTKQTMNLIAPMFKENKDTLILSCLQGHMGNAWADSNISPSCAQIITADFCFFSGDSSLPDSKTLVENIPSQYKYPWILMIPQNDSWGTLIEEAYEGRFHKFNRYAIKKEKGVFDTNKLKTYIDKLSHEFELVKIDRKIYDLSFKESWSSSFCSQFSSFEDYYNRGIGFAVLHNDELVSGASSYTIYDEGIEIEIATKKEYRKMGLATACASKLILECIKKGLYPSWDAANKQSVALAEKLGYKYDKEYVTYEIKLR